MNLVETRHPINFEQAKKHGSIFGTLAAPFGVSCVILFGIVLISESLYRNKLHHAEGEVIFIGGLATCIGGLILLRAVLIAKKRWNNYTTILSRSAIPTESFLVITDEHIERGVLGFWSDKFNWSLLTNFVERKNFFTIEFGITSVCISKEDLDNEKNCQVFRDLLAVKANRPPIVPTK